MTAPQPVQPQPTAFSFDFNALTTDQGVKLVLMRLHLITGIVILFLTPDEAKGFAARLETAAVQAQSGLIVPPPGSRIG